MGREIPLGRIAGIKVTMDLSVILIAGFYSYVLATNRFPIQSPGMSTTAYWVAGVSFALLFFVSLLVHEIGHALVARDEGIGVVGISLWLLGGMAKLESSPTNARAEFRIAVVGPLASAACGVVFLVAAYTLPTGGAAGLTGHLFALLGIINLVLAAFNLLPAAPLDGGTVLSSIVWRRTGSHAQGVRWAAYAGIAAGVLMLLGALRVMRADDAEALDGIGLLVVGGFVLFAAYRSLRAYPLYHLLDGLTVADAMNPPPPAVPGWFSLADGVAALPTGAQHAAYPVLSEQGTVSGLLSARAVHAVPREQWPVLRVTDVAYPIERVTVVSGHDQLLSGLQRLDNADVRDGLVVGPDGSIIGLIDPSVLYPVVERRKAELAAHPG